MRRRIGVEIEASASFVGSRGKGILKQALREWPGKLRRRNTHRYAWASLPTPSEEWPRRFGQARNVVETHTQSERLGKPRRRNEHPGAKARQPTSSEPTPRRLGHPFDDVGRVTWTQRSGWRRRWNRHLAAWVTLPTHTPDTPRCIGTMPNPCSTSRLAISGKFFPSFSMVVPNYFKRHHSPSHQLQHG